MEMNADSIPFLSHNGRHQNKQKLPRLEKQCTLLFGRCCCCCCCRCRLLFLFLCCSGPFSALLRCVHEWMTSCRMECVLSNRNQISQIWVTVQSCLHSFLAYFNVKHSWISPLTFFFYFSTFVIEMNEWMNECKNVHSLACFPIMIWNIFFFNYNFTIWPFVCLFFFISRCD